VRHTVKTAALTACLLSAPLNAALAERVTLGAPSATADAVVGCIYPMTGRATVYGQDSIDGIRLALADLDKEAAVGLPVPRLSVIVDDALSKSSYALRLAESYITDDHVRFFAAWSVPAWRPLSAIWLGGNRLSWSAPTMRRRG
jgi:branched-chain amino acid transport system substrate-binding protein